MDSLLALSRVSRGPREVSEVYLSGLAREVTGKLRGAEPDRAFSVDIEDGLVAEADAALCKVLLGDLLGNAWKLTAAETLAHIPVCAVGSGGRRVFCVSDDGAGFDQEYAGRLFRPFERLHVQKDFAGAGLAGDGPASAALRRRLPGAGYHRTARELLLHAVGDRCGFGRPSRHAAVRCPGLGRPPVRPGDDGSRPPDAGDAAQGQCSDALQALVDANEQPVFALDRDLRYTAFNRAHATVMRALYGAEIALGGRLPGYPTIAADRDAAVGNLARALAGEHVTACAFSGEGERAARPRGRAYAAVGRRRSGRRRGGARLRRHRQAARAGCLA